MMVLSLVIAFVLTIIIEFGVVRLWKFKGKDENKIVLYMNVITNPALNIMLSLGVLLGVVGSTELFTLFLEVIVVFVEFYILYYVFGKEHTKQKLFLMAFTMNLASYIIGLILFSDRYLDLLG